MDSLEILLKQECRALAQLLGTLNEEHQALLRHDMTALDRASNKKQQQVIHLENLARDRDFALRQHGLAAGHEGIEHSLRQQPRSIAQASWKELQTLLTRCRQQNLVNGGMVEISQRHVKRTLSLLHGQSPEPQTYGPSGATGAAACSQLHATT
jgi:flagella synthesis protein FlgN